MGIVGGALGVRILSALSPDGRGSMPEGVPEAYRNKSKLAQLLGPGIWDEVRGKVVVDFGCGEGREVVELAEHGARQVVGIDTRQAWLDHAAELAAKRGVADRCAFVQHLSAPNTADLIICLDAFEHFAEPAAILATMHAIVRPGGCVLVAFGPPWYHPLGGHIFSVFPWAHFIFSEYAMVTWRSQLPGKRPTKSVREAGLNQMTVRRFEQLVAESPFQFASFEAVPIRRLRMIANYGLREFTTSIVRCRLVSRDGARAAPPRVTSPRIRT
jgi:SAM-dependent methyltransferase